ncbi:MAG TPA: class I SAM-dependent methyltransferase, partial [Hyphomicrobiaceae bacterium]|nr:class I SAM-dependent methyltransferase [Hyphomicrobiaceae bacterium]
FSSFSPALLEHSRLHVDDLLAERQFGEDSLVVEVASNDGYLLKHFKAAGVPVLGIDPARGPAEAACSLGIPTLTEFFSAGLASELRTRGISADVMLANNVLAHVEDINAFVAGFPELLKPGGIVEFEFPYVRDLIESCAFDTIYHEHVFYYSLTSLEPLLARHGLFMNDVRRLSIHAGSLRLRASAEPTRTKQLEGLIREERELGLDRKDYYASFAGRVSEIRRALVGKIRSLAGNGARIAAYGAAAKGATLLNYTGLGPREIDYVVDRNHHKVGKYMPGQRLEIRPVSALSEDRPDYLLLLAWNFAEEIIREQSRFAAEGGQFIIPIPTPRVFGAAEPVGR